MKDKKITIILGGFSKEREVSVRTGTAIYNVLSQAGYQVSNFDAKLDEIHILSKENTDVAFIALHGKYGEDGCIQGYLETLQIPYTGSGVMSSALCYDKIRTKIYLKNYNILTPKFWVYYKGQDIEKFLKTEKITVPAVTKPNREGSTIGMKIVQEEAELSASILEAAKFCDEVLIEEFIDGREVTIGMLNGKALPSVEIAPKSGFYDYESKYTAGKTEYFTPARIAPEMEEELKTISEKITKYLDCRGAPRLDYIIDKNNKPYFLEINTIPGMTETSLLPKAAKGVGMDFKELCEQILLSARLDN